MKKLLFFPALLAAFPLSAQISFTSQIGLLTNQNYSSGSAIGVFDANGDGKDDIIRNKMTASMNINYQQTANGAFSEQSYNLLGADMWGMCAGDVNNDGQTDILWCTGNNALLSTANSSATTYTSTNVTTATSAGFIFPQGCNIADIDNDGKNDLFVCNDVDMSHIYQNLGGGSWLLDQSLIPLATSPVSDNSGNYASIFSDINNDGFMDFYITHCRQGITNPADPRRINQVFLNNGNFTYTQDITNTSNLRIGAQSWSTAFGDINNDGAMDAFVLNYDVESNFMLNNGSGVFTDITSTAGVLGSTNYFGINTSFHDFDNDGFVDLLIGGVDFSQMAPGHRLYRNNGDSTFTQVTAFGTTSMGAYGVGDLNHDGFLDVFASYCDGFSAVSASGVDDIPWFNNGNSNHWIAFNLTGVQSNKSGIGSIVKIYGPWGVQVREVRGGEGYGIQNTLAAHFGLGNYQTVDSVVVQWPSGTVDVLTNLSSNVFMNITEGSATAVHHNEAAKPVAAVYPNPAHENASLRIENFTSFGNGNLSVRITDLSGREVYRENNLQRSIIPMGNLNGAGMYFYSIISKGEILTSGKFIIE